MTGTPSSAILRWRGRGYSPKICRMGARRFLNEILVVSPLLLIAGITVNARTRVENYVPVQYSSGLNQQIAAYVEPVRLVEEATRRGAYLADPVRIRQIGLTWRNMTRQGVLEPLHPEMAEDSCREGIKGQIRAAADDLASALQFLAQEGLSEGRAYEASQDAVLAMEAVQGLKYSDLFSIGMFSVRENASLVVLEKAAAHLSPLEKSNIAARLETLRAGAKPLADIVMTTQRVRRTEVANQSPRAMPQFKLAIQMARDMDRDFASAQIDTLYAELGKSMLARESDSFLPELRFALHATRNVMRDWSVVAAKLG